MVMITSQELDSIARTIAALDKEMATDVGEVPDGRLWRGELRTLQAAAVIPTAA